MIFLWTPASLIVSLLVLLAGAACCLISWRRGGKTRPLALLELLRFTLIVLVLITLNQPEIPQQILPVEQPRLVVLHDVSGSMQTLDSSSEAGIVTRQQTADQLIQPAVWQPVAQKMQVLFEPFSSPQPTGARGTDLHSALAAAAAQHNGLRGLVVISDGDWNTGEAPAAAASQLRVRGVPVYSIPVGSEKRLPDLVLTAADAPTFAVAGKALRIPFRITSWLPAETSIAVTLTGTRQEPVTRLVKVPGMGQLQDALEWKPTVTGEYSLSLQIPVSDLEIRQDNNQLTIPIAVREEELRVLIIESLPRWEYRYLRNALERDPGVSVSCLLLHPDLPDNGGGRGYLAAFPEDAQLFEYDVVFLGDVGTGPRGLTAQQCASLKQLVRNQAGGLVFLPGIQGNQASLASTELDELLPVVMSTAVPRGRGTARPGRFALTEAGRRSLLTRLESDDIENEKIWNGLPGFYWYAAAERARAGAQVLATHDSESTAFGRVPLIAARTSGTGKVLYMGSDGAWRWRKGVEDLYHYRFWGQVVRWMAYQRNMSQGESMRLFFAPDRPEAGSAVTLNANVMTATGEPLREGSVTVQAVAPSGATESIRLAPAGQDSWGLFTGDFVPREGGQYVLKAACAETGARLEMRMSVLGQEREQTGQPAKPDVLREISRMTQGESADVTAVQQLVQKLAALPEPEPVIVPLRIWSHPLWGGLIITLLGIFWTARKFAGLA
ncbi:MAG: hypothetical protein ACKO3T_21135 [Planctomycetaceae bacterium]